MNCRENINQSNGSVIFLHIPKAAGSTLNTILDRQYRKYKIFSINGARIRESTEAFKNLPEEERARIKLLKGHMHFGLHAYLPRPSVYITVLRNPVDRIVSHYYYVLRNPDHYLYDSVSSRNMSLEDYVVSGISPELRNGQARVLVSHGKDDDLTTRPEEFLEAVKENLGRYFVVVGIAERFDETMVIMKKTLGWRGYPLYLKQNVAEKRPRLSELPGVVLEKIRQTNELDCRLYDWAEKEFGKRVSGDPVIRRELAFFRLLNLFFRKYSWFRYVLTDRFF